MSKLLFGVLMTVLSFGAIACEGARNVGHPSSTNASFPSQYLWEVGLAHATIEAYPQAQHLGEYCVRYPDGIREMVKMRITISEVRATQVAGTRVAAPVSISMGTCTVGPSSTNSGGTAGWMLYYYTIWVFEDGRVDESKGMRYDGADWIDASQLQQTPGEPMTCVR